MFRAYVLIIWRLKLHYTAFGIIKPIGGRLVHRLREDVCVLSYYVYLWYYMCIFFLFTLNAGLLATGQYSEGPATGHLDTGFSWFPCAQKQMLRWFP